MTNYSNPPLIAVLGVTGGGKTTFIQKATGDLRLVIGHGLGSCTSEMNVSSMTIDGAKVLLIDTPGFDDTTKTDTEIFEMIAEHLAFTYKAGKLLNGLVILQPVTAMRFQGNESRQTRLLEKIIGPNNYHKVVIATTMWNQLKDEQAGQRRVDERCHNDQFWGSMISKGARVVRHEDTRESAIKIVRMLYKEPKAELLLQTELGQNKGRLLETTAGMELNKDLDERCAKLVAELEKIRREHNTTVEDLRRVSDKLQTMEEEKERLKQAEIPWTDKIIDSVVSAFNNFGKWCEEEYTSQKKGDKGIDFEKVYDDLVEHCVVM